LLLEKEELEDLKEEMAEYQEDVQELRDITHLDKESKLKESKGARRY
jgi:LETM1 and EF-hand domain-containing protein 1, mitochondrial